MQSLRPIEPPQVANSIQAPMHLLARNLTANKISRQLRSRPSKEYLLEKGVLEGNLVSLDLLCYIILICNLILSRE